MQFHPTTRCVGGVVCFLLDWALAPSKVVCRASEPSLMWHERAWECVAPEAYVFDIALRCEGQCPPLAQCVTEYDLYSTVMATVAFFVLLGALATVGMAAYYILGVRPQHVALPYLTGWGKKSFRVEMHSLANLRARVDRPHQV